VIARAFHPTMFGFINLHYNMRALVQRVTSAEVWVAASALSASPLSTPLPLTPLAAVSALISTSPLTGGASSGSGEAEQVCVGRIGRGLIAYIGIAAKDTPDDLAWLLEKLCSFRLFEGDSGKMWSGSIESQGLSILLVSQFTLHASTKKAKPDFHRAMGTEPAREMFNQLVSAFQSRLGTERVATGLFGAMMNVVTAGDGPVTIMLDSWNKDGDVNEVNPAGTPTVSPVSSATPKGSVSKGAKSQAGKAMDAAVGPPLA
jgi:D-tyrosyl-tRNA(Tyr) deacylase